MDVGFLTHAGHFSPVSHFVLRYKVLSQKTATHRWCLVFCEGVRSH